MSVILTTTDFKLRFPDIRSPTAVIDDFIEMVQQIQPCLESNYSDAVVRLIAYNLLAHFCEQSSGKRVKSQSAPNGASQSYDLGAMKDGLGETSYGRLAMSLDTAGCASSLTDIGVIIMSIGGRNAP